MKHLMAFVFMAALLMASPVKAEEITIDGATANAGLLGALTDAFMKDNPGKMIVNANPGVGTGGGIKGAEAGKFALGRVGRPLKEAEKQGGLKEILFAKIPMFFIVNNASAVNNLTSQQICDIYSGKIDNWKDITGEDKKIYVISRNADAATLSTVKETVPGFKDITITERAIVMMSDKEGISAVEKKDGAIAFCVPSNLTTQNVKVLKVNDQEYSNPGYVVQAVVGLVYKGELSGLAKEFVDYIYSPAGQTVLKNQKCAVLPR